MGKFIELIVGALIFYIIFAFLLPLLPAAILGISKVILVVAAIIWLLSLIGGTWPWRRVN